MTTETIWTTFSGRLRSFIAKRVRDEDDVQDLLQEVFAKIHSGLDGVKDGERIESWLFQVTRRAIVDHFRRKRPAELPADLPEKDASSDLSGEVAGWLEPMMELLPEEDREALRRTDLEGVPQKELAARLGLSVTGAKSRVQRARRRLKSVLLDCCHIERDRRGNPIDYRRRRSGCSCDSPGGACG